MYTNLAENLDLKVTLQKIWVSTFDFLVHKCTQNSGKSCFSRQKVEHFYPLNWDFTVQWKRTCLPVCRKTFVGFEVGQWGTTYSIHNKSAFYSFQQCILLFLLKKTKTWCSLLFSLFETSINNVVNALFILSFLPMGGTKARCCCRIIRYASNMTRYQDIRY